MRIRTLLIALLMAATATHARADNAESKTEYLAMLLNGQKIGYVKNVRTVADGKVTTEATSDMTFDRAGTPMKITQRQRWVETLDGKLIELESVSMLGTFKGVVNAGGQLELSQTSATGGSGKRTIDLPKDALFAEGMRLEQKRRGYKVGTKYDVKSFLPELGGVITVHIEVGKKEKLDLLGRVVEGVKVTSVTDLGMMKMPQVTYLDDDGDLLRMDMDMAGMTISALACDKAFALSPVKTTVDFIDATLLRSPKPIPAKAKRVVYTVKPKAGKEITIPGIDTQQVEKQADGTIRVTVSCPAPPKGDKLPYAGKNASALEALKPNVFVQSDDAKIIAAARGAVGSTTDMAEAARRIADWVSKHVTRKDLSVGYASASEVLRSGQGDCTEHSVLAAAMCRAAGIPARIADGMAYVPEWRGRKNIFVGHQWTQVFVGGKWYDLDATIPPAFRNAQRITLMTNSGEAREFIALLANFGKFEITDVTVLE